MKLAAALLAVAPALVHAQTHADARLDSLAAAAAAGTARFADRRVAAAEGYRRIGPDFPGMGEHWLNPGVLLTGAMDARKPTILIYANIAGAPKLLGVGFVTTTHADEPAGDVPGWPHAWHEHSGLLADESGVAPGSRAPTNTHVWVLHAWTGLKNPDGDYRADNWALPFARAQVPVPANASADASRALALLNGGDIYLRDVLSDAALRTSSNAAAVDSVIAAAKARVASARPALQGDALNSLGVEWTAMAAALRELLGPSADRYLMPAHPHAGGHP